MPTSFGVAKAFRSGEFRDPAVTYGDFFVFNLIMTAGSDLDIRCKLLNPTGVNETIGWGRDNTMRHNNITFAYWGGDNTGGGRETFYLDRAQFLQAFPSATSFEFDLRCFWNAVSGGDVITNIDAYQGGSMVLNTNTRVWENPTADNDFPASKSASKVITLQTSNVETEGQRASRVQVNLSAETIQFFAN